MTGRRRRHRRGNKAAEAAASPAGPDAAAVAEDPGERAARLGITRDRVLEELRRVAFANLRHIVEWDDSGMTFKPAGELTEDDAAAIAEITAAAATGRPYRIKLFDKKPALDAIARYLRMFPPTRAAPHQDERTRYEGDDPHEILARKIARLAAGGEAE